MFGAVAEELDETIGEPLLVLRHVRLTAAQARHLRAELERLVEGAEEAGTEEAVHGVLVALYEQGRHVPGGEPDTAKE